VRFVDELLEDLARGRLLGQIVFDELDVLTFQVSNRFAAARSTRFEVHLDAFRHHFFLTHQASGAADGAAAATHVAAQPFSASIC